MGRSPPIGIKVGDIKYHELINQLNEWFEQHSQDLQPGGKETFSHEGEFQIPGVRGMFRLKLELSGLE